MFYNRNTTGRKYNNILKEYGGRTYHSKKEADYARELDLLKRAHEIKEWEPQHRIKLVVHGSLVCSIIVDFRIEHNDGSIELVEIKGYATDDWKIKWKLLGAIYKEEHPEIKLTVIK